MQALQTRQRSLICRGCEAIKKSAVQLPKPPDVLCPRVREGPGKAHHRRQQGFHLLCCFGDWCSRHRSHNRRTSVGSRSLPNSAAEVSRSAARQPADTLQNPCKLSRKSPKPWCALTFASLSRFLLVSTFKNAGLQRQAHCSGLLCKVRWHL